MRGSRAARLWATSLDGRPFSTARPCREEKATDEPLDQYGSGSAAAQKKEEGAMSRRLSEMAADTIDTGSKTDRRLMQEVGFSDELKKQLEERIAQTAFAAQHQQAASEVNMPVCPTTTT